MRQSAVIPPHIVEKRTRKALWRKRRKQRARSQPAQLVGSPSGSPNRLITLLAPEYFGLLNRKHHERLVQFLRALVGLTLTDHRSVRIDFGQTVKFYADGTMLFFAELKRILARRPNSVRCVLPRAPVPRQVLSHLGILKLLGYSGDFPSTRQDVTNWQVLSGVVADATLGIGPTIEALPKLSREQIGKLFRSVTEALTNVTQHAYTEPRMDNTGIASDRGWWMFVKQEPEKLSISFCDLGLGVPYTVPRLPKHSTWLAARLASIVKAVAGLGHHQDGQIIQVTVDEKRSRFQATNRGNGFGNMLETINAAGEGRLSIHSNSGCYSFVLSRRGKERHRAYNYEDSIYGTVVSWQIAMTEQA